MFVDEPPPASEYLPPPTYQDSITSTRVQSALPTFHFFKSSGLKARAARLQSTDGRKYHLTADIHKSTSSTIQLYSDQDGTCLGSVLFTPNSNSFQIMTSGTKGNSAPADLIQVRARIGVPHPQAYTFALNKARDVMWTRLSSSTGYQLKDTTWQTSLATWELVDKEKFGAVLRWQECPRDAREEIVVILSFIGSMTRLRLKGRDTSGLPNSGRWGTFLGLGMMGNGGKADF